MFERKISFSSYFFRFQFISELCCPEMIIATCLLCRKNFKTNKSQGLAEEAINKKVLFFEKRNN
jgi:hypothetical protein